MLLLFCVAAFSQRVMKVEKTDGSTVEYPVTDIRRVYFDSFDSAICPDKHHPHKIDLGLPSGTIWACCNVGAHTPEEYGGYYAWGDTEDKRDVNWVNYIHYNDTDGSFYDLGSDISGTVYDVAQVRWGGGWQMPNKEKFDELANYCASEWTSVNGVVGRMFVSNLTDGKLFLPAAGYYLNGNHIYAGRIDYWSSTKSGSSSAYGFNSDSDRNDLIDDLRIDCQSVRPVYNESSPIANLSISNSTISLKQGEITTAEITAGSGSYIVVSKAPSIATVKLDGTTITIEAVTTGIATITVIDTQSGQTVSIEVEVGDAPTSEGITMEQYEEAKAYIQAGGLYRIFTLKNGTDNGSEKYYLKEDGCLTDNELEARTFTFNYVTGSDLYASPGWKLDVPFTHPELSNGTTGVLNPQGYIHTNWTTNRNDWEGQVWYKKGNYYAVRSTNAVSEEGGASTFWTVLDTNADGLPEADYSMMPQFIWQLEKSDEAVKAHLCPDTNHPHSIDLGIGLKWSCCNVGASYPWEFGEYYAWGETVEKTEYNWWTYSHWNNKNNDSYVNADEIDLGMNISGTMFDAARVNWGTPWRMPTRDEMNQFMNPL